MGGEPNAAPGGVHTKDIGKYYRLIVEAARRRHVYSSEASFSRETVPEELTNGQTEAYPVGRMSEGENRRGSWLITWFGMMPGLGVHR